MSSELPSNNNDSSAATNGSDSVELIARFCSGDGSAATRIFERYVVRLTLLARARLSPKLAVRIDPDDVVMSAYRSFFLGLQRGEYRLERGGDLWRLLVEVTLHKLYRQAAHHTAQRRSVQNELNAERPTSVDALDRDPLPEEVAAATDELQWLIERLPPNGRRVLELRLQGEKIDAIAAELACSERTVRRMIEHSRRLMIERNRNDE